MNEEDRILLSPVVRLIAKYDVRGALDDLGSLVEQLRLLARVLPDHYRKDAVTTVVLADRKGNLAVLESLGFLSDLAVDSSGDVVRLAAFAYWRLKRPERAAELQAESLKKPMSVQPTADLGTRVGSAIQNYRRLATLESLMLAWRSFEQLAGDSDAFRANACAFVIAISAHSHLDSEVAGALLSAMESAEPEQALFRLVAFVHWRRGDPANAATWQARSLVAPALLWSESQLHYLARRANERPDLFER